MTRDQIDDVAKAARVAAIGQAVKHGNRCVFAIVVCGLDVGAPMAVASNLTDPAKPEDITRILQNGIRAIQNNPGGGKTGGGLILLSALLLWLGALLVASGCGSVEAMTDANTGGTDRGGAVAAAGAAGGGAGGNAGAGGMAGGPVAGAGGAAGATGGAAAGGAAAGDVDAGMTGAAGAGGSCTPREAGAICYQCPAPAPTCAVPNRGAWACCDKGGTPSCDLTWCRQ